MNHSVLLVGGCRELVCMMSRLLERSGYCTYSAVGFSEAEALLRQQTPDLIIMDCELPGESGLSVCRKLRQQNVMTKILLVSYDSADELKAFDSGADDFVKKPYQLEVMIARMKRLCTKL